VEKNQPATVSATQKLALGKEEGKFEQLYLG